MINVAVIVPLLVAVAVPQVLCTNGLDWQVKTERMNPSGVVVQGYANTPTHDGFYGRVHGSHVLGGPYNGDEAVGGGINYQNNNGVHGAVDAIHVRGQGTAYSANVGVSTKLGPGTLSVNGGAGTLPGSSKVQGQVGVNYSIPLP